MSVNLFVASFLFSFETILKLQDGEITRISSPFFNFVGITEFTSIIKRIFRFKKYFIT